jgi:hypothetical protein
VANLISRTTAREPFAALDPEQRSRFESRLGTLVTATSSPDSMKQLERSLGVFETPLDELESEASLVAALDLLDGIARLRLAAIAMARDPDALPEAQAPLPPSPPGGDLIFYRPGCSLSTGEPNVASRGFFDMLDRPPIGYWLEAIARPTGPTREEFEVAILAWIPVDDLDRARAGCRACTSGSLVLLGEASQELTRQLRPILDGRSEQ